MVWPRLAERIQHFSGSPRREASCQSCSRLNKWRGVPRGVSMWSGLSPEASLLTRSPLTPGDQPALPRHPWCWLGVSRGPQASVVGRGGAEGSARWLLCKPCCPAAASQTVPRSPLEGEPRAPFSRDPHSDLPCSQAGTRQGPRSGGGRPGKGVRAGPGLSAARVTGLGGLKQWETCGGWAEPLSSEGNWGGGQGLAGLWAAAHPGRV